MSVVVRVTPSQQPGSDQRANRGTQLNGEERAYGGRTHNHAVPIPLSRRDHD